MMGRVRKMREKKGRHGPSSTCGPMLLETEGTLLAFLLD
jgi:hypothetical protein